MDGRMTAWRSVSCQPSPVSRSTSPDLPVRQAVWLNRQMASDPPLRPTLRTIARAAGVSVMTVSRALRNVGNISPRQRARVQRIATQLGYRPDPTVAKLMHHLRIRRKPAYQGLLCALTTHRPNTQLNFFVNAVFTGARQRADARGYGFSLMQLEPSPESRRRLQRILTTRGVEGLVLLPMVEPLDLSDWLDWGQFALVSTSGSVLGPEVARVLPTQFANTQLLCGPLMARGYRRIGLAIETKQDQRVNHVHTAAVAWHNLHRGGVAVAPLIYDGDLPSRAELRAWVRREKIDVLVATQNRDRQLAEMLGWKVPGPFGVAATSVVPNSIFGGIDEMPAEIGAAAVDLLATMIQRGEKGVPAV